MIADKQNGWKDRIIRELSKYVNPEMLIIVKGTNLVQHSKIEHVNYEDDILLNEHFLIIISKISPGKNNIGKYIENNIDNLDGLYLVALSTESFEKFALSGNRFMKRVFETGHIFHDVGTIKIPAGIADAPVTTLINEADVIIKVHQYADDFISAGKYLCSKDQQYSIIGKKPSYERMYITGAYQYHQAIEHMAYAFIQCTTGYLARHESFRRKIAFCRKISRDIDKLFPGTMNPVVDLLSSVYLMHKYGKVNPLLFATLTISDDQIVHMGMLAELLFGKISPVCKAFINEYNPYPHGRTSISPVL